MKKALKDAEEDKGLRLRSGAMKEKEKVGGVGGDILLDVKREAGVPVKVVAGIVVGVFVFTWLVLGSLDRWRWGGLLMLMLIVLNRLFL